MSHAFLDEWAAWEPTSAPFVFPGDEVLLSASAEEGTTRFASPQEYIESSVFNDPTDFRLHLGLRPIPMLGDLGRAKVVFLLLNPGLDPGDYFANANRGPYVEGLRRSVRQDLEGTEFPFLFLDPALSWHPGFGWWNRKLSPFIHRAHDRNGGSPKDALRSVARGVANIELYPYHSRKFGVANRIRKKLRSVELARSYVHEVLVPKARSGEIVLVVMRRADEWQIPRGPFIHILDRKEARGGHLNEGTRNAILERLGLDRAPCNSGRSAADPRANKADEGATHFGEEKHLVRAGNGIRSLYERYRRDVLALGDGISVHPEGARYISFRVNGKRFANFHIHYGHFKLWLPGAISDPRNLTSKTEAGHTARIGDDQDFDYIMNLIHATYLRKKRSSDASAI